MKKITFSQCTLKIYNRYLISLKNSLHNRGLKQERIAEAMHTSASHISERLSGKIDLDLKWLIDLCIKHDMKPSEILHIQVLDEEYMKLLQSNQEQNGFQRRSK